MLRLHISFELGLGPTHKTGHISSSHRLHQQTTTTSLLSVSGRNRFLSVAVVIMGFRFRSYILDSDKVVALLYLKLS